MLYCDAIVDAMVKGLGQQAACVRYNILTSFLDVVFLYWLLPRYGMEGYFTSFFITHLINFLLSLGRLRKITPITIPAKVPILTALSAAASVWAASYLPHPVSQAMGCLAILSCLLLLLGVVNREDGRWLFGLLRKNDL